MFKITKKRVGAVVVVAALAIGIPVAYSWWTQGGTGSGTASTGETVAITVNQDAFDGVEDALYPGGDYVDLTGTFTNTNDGPVYVDHITAEVTNTTDANGEVEGCTAADFDITGDGDVTDEIITGDTWGNLQIKMNNLGENQDDCKNVTVNIAYTAHAGPAEED